MLRFLKAIIHKRNSSRAHKNPNLNSILASDITLECLRMYDTGNTLSNFATCSANVFKTHDSSEVRI